jgi:hypothetical protein
MQLIFEESCKISLKKPTLIGVKRMFSVSALAMYNESVSRQTGTHFFNSL